MRLRALTFTAAGLLTLACFWYLRPPRRSLELSAADNRAIAELEVRWAATWATKNVAAILDYYADNASVRLPDWGSWGFGRLGPDAWRWFPVIGKRNIREELANLMQDSNLTITVSPSYPVGPFAITSGEYSIERFNPKTGSPFLMYRDAYSTSYNKGPDGVWRISRQTFEGGNAGPADPIPTDSGHQTA